MFNLSQTELENVKNVSNRRTTVFSALTGADSNASWLNKVPQMQTVTGKYRESRTTKNRKGSNHSY